MRKLLFTLLLVCISASFVLSQNSSQENNDFAVKGFHLDLRIQVMTIPELKNFASQLHSYGINTLIMEWEATYPFEKHPLIPNRYAYTKEEIISFIKYCNGLGIDVIPLQQSFGHVEYILRNYRYKNLREDQKDYSQVCPLQEEEDKALFTDLYTELISTHTSNYIHIGGDETYLLGHCPRCSLKVQKEGKSKLYIDYIKMLCDIVIKLGKRPILWADIALAYPDAIKLLPRETIFIDWNYGWDINRFGDHNKLVESGYEIWGAPSLRSHPDNYFLTQWEKHFKNIRDFIPAARKTGYKGIVMTSWSTSGQYSTVNESETDMINLYAIRHVYPVTGFNILLGAYAESLKSSEPLDIEKYIEKYCAEKYGFTKEQSAKFWNALTTAPYEVSQGTVIAPVPLSLTDLLDSAKAAAKILFELQAVKNKTEFEQYRLMADIRVQYLSYENIEAFVNSDKFDKSNIPEVLGKLKLLIDNSKKLDERFIALNKSYFQPEELKQENELRNVKIKLLYDRLAGIK
jgi:hexosaminidase